MLSGDVFSTMFEVPGLTLSLFNRSDGILILSGGLTIHTFRDFSALTEKTADEKYKQWHRAVVEAGAQQSVSVCRRVSPQSI
jgi:aromatic ring-opening dioxygenase catalytic subunit (LigB family)